MLLRKRFMFALALVASLVISFSQALAYVTNTKTYVAGDIKLYYTDISGSRNAAYFEIRNTIIFRSDMEISPYDMYPMTVTQQGIAVQFSYLENMSMFTSIADVIDELQLRNIYLNLNGNIQNYNYVSPYQSNIYGVSGGQSVPLIRLTNICTNTSGARFYVHGAGSNVFWDDYGQATRYVLTEVHYQ